MRHFVNRHKLLIIALILLCPISCFAQGKVTRKSTPKRAAIVKPAVSNPDGYINKHGYVDLGLPSGTKWATCNIGSHDVSCTGDIFRWGELQPRVRWDNNYVKPGVSDIGGNVEFDAAAYLWGSPWRIPGETEFRELLNYCRAEWIRYGSVFGYKFTGPNGKSIFLPAEGFKNGNYPNGSSRNETGNYWTSITCESAGGKDTCAVVLGFVADDVPDFWEIHRATGRSIRPVVR